MAKERINMYLDRSRLELAQKKALERGVPISTAGNISELVRQIIDEYIDNKNLDKKWGKFVELFYKKARRAFFL